MDLSLCPFCSSLARSFEETNEVEMYLGRFGVECLDDECGATIDRRPSIESAIGAWNRRGEI